jgi:LacI family transcriptional regulator
MNLEKIARLAGVSRSTVSRVINNHPYVSDDVRQRVMEVIEREGFQPNAAARMLVRQRTEVIAVIAPEGLNTVLSSNYFPILLGGISTTITRADYAMSLWAGSTAEEIDRMYKRILSYKLMDGALLISAMEGDTFPLRLQERKMPLVMIGHTNLHGVSSVDVDNIQAAYDATEHLIHIGRTRIAHIGGRMDLTSARERFQGYRQALDAYGLNYDHNLIVHGDFTEVSGYAAATKLLPRGVDAAFACNDMMAAGFMRGAIDQGKTVPDDISVIGFDDLPISLTNMPALSTVRQPIHDLGVAATQLLIQIINGEAEEPQRITLPTELVIRETSGGVRV